MSTTTINSPEELKQHAAQRSAEDDNEYKELLLAFAQRLPFATERANRFFTARAARLGVSFDQVLEQFSGDANECRFRIAKAKAASSLADLTKQLDIAAAAAAEAKRKRDAVIAKLDAELQSLIAKGNRLARQRDAAHAADRSLITSVGDWLATPIDECRRALLQVDRQIQASPQPTRTTYKRDENDRLVRVAGSTECNFNSQTGEYEALSDSPDDKAALKTFLALKSSHEARVRDELIPKRDRLHARLAKLKEIGRSPWPTPSDIEALDLNREE